MKIQLAEARQIDDIMAMYDHSRIVMRNQGNVVQWTNGYPQRELILADIERGDHYVMQHGDDLVGTFFFKIGEEPTYRIIDGRWLNEQTYGFIHRIATNGSTKGIAERCFQWCFNQHPNIRVDTHSTNSVMQYVLTKLRYSKCGVIYVGDGTPRLAYHKGQTSSSNSCFSYSSA